MSRGQLIDFFLGQKVLSLIYESFDIYPSILIVFATVLDELEYK